MESNYLLNTQPIEIYRNASGQEFWRGYAAVWHDPNDPGTEYRMSEHAREHVAKTAFDKALRSGQKIGLYFNHDGNSIMDDTQHSLVLSLDNKGLRYEAPYDPTDPDHVKARVKKEKGLLKGSSFGFDTRKTTYNINRDDKGYVRTLQDIALMEVSMVYDPAYPSSSATIRKELDHYEKVEEIRKRAAKYLVPSDSDPKRSSNLTKQGIDGNTVGTTPQR